MSELAQLGEHFGPGLKDELVAKVTEAMQLIIDETLNKREFGDDPMPTLRGVQNTARKTHKEQYGNVNDIRVARELAAIMAQSDSTTPSTGYAFGANAFGATGEVIIGDGSDKFPFRIGFTSKQALQKLYRVSKEIQVIMHCDSTFKTDTVAYPVFVWGFSGLTGRYHLVAQSISPQRRRADVEYTLISIKQEYECVNGSSLDLEFFMGDEDAATRNGIARVYPLAKYLMWEKRADLSRTQIRLVFEGVYDLHFTTNPGERDQVVGAVLQQREIEAQQSDSMRKFVVYMEEGWLPVPGAKFPNWQIYLTSVGMATTSNAVDQFDAVITSVYTDRSRLHVSALMRLGEVVSVESENDNPITIQPQASTRLLQRYRSTVKEGRINGVVGTYSTSIVFVLQTREGKVRASHAYESFGDSDSARIKKIESRASSVNYERMELRNMPLSGWQVNIPAMFYPCPYFTKFGTCVYVIHAVKITQEDVPEEKSGSIS